MSSRHDSFSEIAKIAEQLRAAQDLSATALLKAGSSTGRFQVSPARANLLRHLDFSGLEMLELGAGCGGLSRSLAEKAARFVVVETRAPWREALAERLRDLPSVRVCAEAGELEGTFDLVVVAESFEAESTAAFEERLRTGMARLRPGGLLAFACNNRLGLGAFAGQPDRHSRTYFGGLAGGERAGEGRSRLEWKRHLAGLGFEIKAEYLLSPDVWLPTCVLQEELIAEDRALAVDLLCHQPLADPTLPTFPLLPPALLAESVARGGLLADLAPAYLWLCGKADRALLAALRGDETDGATLGWHYATERRPATLTRFFRRDAALWVEKTAITAAPSSLSLRWNAQPAQPLLRGQRWRQRLVRSAYFEKGDFEAELARLLSLLREPFAREGDRLAGKALDAILHNAILGEDGETRVFDLEWELLEDIPASWWVLRNVLALAPALDTTGHGIGAVDLAELYQRLCRRLEIAPALEEDLERESRLQAELGGDAEASREAMAALLARPLTGSPFPPRRPERFGPWQEEIRRQSLEIDRLSRAFAGLSRLADDVKWLAEAVGGQQKSLASIDEALRWLGEKVAEKG